MKRRYLRISSEERTPESKSASEFTVNIPSSGGILDSVVAYAVHSAELPNVFDNIGPANNVFSLGTPAVVFAIVPPSYYTASSFIAAATAAINAAIAPITVVITLTGIAPKQKFLFTFSAPVSIIVTPLDIAPVAGAAGITATLGPGLALQAQSIPNLIGATTAYIHSSVLAPSNLVEANGSFSVVDSIALDKPYGVTCYLATSNELTHLKYYRPFESVKTLRQITITIRDRDGNILLLPDNFGFTLMLVAFYA
jgi:hypothetical protein